MPVETVLVEIDHRTAIVTLDRPSSGNRINERMAFELRDACDQLSRDNAVWAVIITGKGDAFCLGADLSDATQRAQGRLAEALRSLRVAGSVAAIGKPVVAALNGDSIDQGLELALACDIRIASDQGRFGLTHVKEGLIPWDGGTQRLPRLVGRSWGMEMILTSRLVEAREALDMGLVNEVAPPDQVLTRAREIAFSITSHGPIAAQYLKEAVLEGLDLPLEQGLRLEADLNIILQSTADRAEGIDSFLKRRRPQYTGQ